MPAPGTLLQNRYRIIRLLGEGGMGAVYLARDERLKRDIALKECFFTDDSLLRAFEREALLLANLNHPALPRVNDHFTEEASQFLVMDFIEGDDLIAMLGRRGSPFSVDEALRWADQLLGALEYLHSRLPPIIHRDIKPQNIKLTEEGRIVLLDFGLAKGVAWHQSQMATGRSVRGYTPSYAPIEQMKGTGTDARSDLYSLAATLYHLLTGETPVDALTRVTEMATEEADPLRPANEINPHVPSAVAEVLKKAMSIKPERRPASAAEMRRMLMDGRNRPAPEKGDEPTVIVGSPASTSAGPTFEFETVTVDSSGNVKDRHKGQARQLVEDLGGGVTLEMVEIPAGTFTMGSPETETNRSSAEGPQHQVSVPSFYMGKYEVTQAQWKAVAGLLKVSRDLNPDPSNFKWATRPVENVSWEDAVEFCERLSRARGKEYRLPTEAEWEYACRAGTTTPFAFGETITPDIVNYDGNYPYASAPKGTYRQSTIDVGSLGVANGFGLYDMHGNVWEWCGDWYSENYYSQSTSVDPTGPSTGSYRVLRGGSWGNFAGNCRSADRIRFTPSNRGSSLGFRLVRTYP